MLRVEDPGGICLRESAAMPLLRHLISGSAKFGDLDHLEVSIVHDLSMDLTR